MKSMYSDDPKCRCCSLFPLAEFLQRFLTSSVTFVEPLGGNGSQSRLIHVAMAFAVDVFVSPMSVANEHTITDEMNPWSSIHVKLLRHHFLFRWHCDWRSQELRRALRLDAIDFSLPWRLHQRAKIYPRGA